MNAPDIVTFPTDPTDGKRPVAIPVEGDADGSEPIGESPFPVKPLAGRIPSGAGNPVNDEMNLNRGPLPGGPEVIAPAS